MKVIIVEDELLAAERLADLLDQLDRSIQVEVILDSVKSAVRWLQNHSTPDLAFFDIQLADGHSFQILEQVELDCPIIFTTAYDQYAIEAFKTNSIAYLLKPINKEDLEQAFAKVDHLKSAFREGTPVVDWDQIRAQLQKTPYKKRFIVKSGAHFYSIKTADIQCFFSVDKMVWLQQFDGKKHVLDLTLDELDNQLAPSQFFRINRKYILNLEAVEKVTAYSGSRLKVGLRHHEKEKIIVSRERVGDFKAWLDQ
jgi:DNA-binding LytR/AlgR family response regulator